MVGSSCRGPRLFQEESIVPTATLFLTKVVKQVFTAVVIMEHLNLFSILTKTTCKREEDPEVTAEKAMRKANEQPLARTKKPSKNKDAASIVAHINKQSVAPSEKKQPTPTADGLEVAPVGEQQEVGSGLV